MVGQVPAMTRRQFLTRAMPAGTVDVSSLPMRCDPAFLEEIVTMAAERDPQFDRRYHELADPLYEMVPPNEREMAFAQLHRRLLAELGYERLIWEVISEFPIIQATIVEVILTKAWHRREEGADLRERLDGNERTKVLTLTLHPKQFASPDNLRRFLRHELLHIADMLDPSFGYQKVGQIAPTKAQEHLIRDRYRVLWDITVDGRLTRMGKETVATKEQRYAEFVSMFTNLPEPERTVLFERLWNDGRPSHDELLSLAKSSGASLTPNGVCPLCQFPTHAWANDLPEKVLALVRHDFPNWTIEQGICERCAELYRVKAGEW